MRNLTKVLEAMLDYIPESEGNFRRAMKGVMHDELYRAPEMQDWNRASTLLMVYMRDLEDGPGWKEDWCETVIKIWKDEV
jgi:hypothetical protein